METEKKMKISEIDKRLKALREERNELLRAASEIDGAYLSSYEIRPSGRHLLTIGKDLIQDPIAAIIELVKNCYDADSRDATIVFCKIPEDDCFEIRIQDHGHGMTTRDIVNKWLVPSTSYKNDIRRSPLGRIMQGRKGIGRYAASILGDDLKLITVDTSGYETILYIQWEQLAQYEYLDQIDIPIETKKTDESSGTTLIIHSKISKNDYWTDKVFQNLRFELKKLIPPNEIDIADNEFIISLEFENFYQDKSLNIQEVIKPYPILDYYDYRISGFVSSEGTALLKYENRRVINGTEEEITENYGETGCGSIKVDIRVYDRDKNAIDQLISRGLHDERGGQITNLQARQLLNEVNGIGVYRNGFRIRPLGDSDYDWLKLNEYRIQNPSLRIGSNQVVGYVHIESEEKSHLEEKSARDGLKNNAAYAALKKITHDIIGELESRRYIFRRKSGLINSGKKLEHQLESLYDYSLLKREISSILKKEDIPNSTIAEIKEIISKEENRKNAAIEEIRKAVAIYQGQATLGKIINVILHEGRRPLNYFKNQIPNLHFYGEHFLKNRDEKSYETILRLTNGISDNAEIFVDLFGRLDPLSSKRRETKKAFLLHDAICDALAVFENEFKEADVKICLNCSTDIKMIGWQQDIYTIIVNLIDNSLFWIREKKSDKRQIEIIVKDTDKGFVMDYYDSGPGIREELLESDALFEPGFTTRPNGTGLGLSIAGEAAMRNGLSLVAMKNDDGAHFVLSSDE